MSRVFLLILLMSPLTLAKRKNVSIDHCYGGRFHSTLLEKFYFSGVFIVLYGHFFCFALLMCVLCFRIMTGGWGNVPQEDNAISNIEDIIDDDSESSSSSSTPSQQQTDKETHIMSWMDMFYISENAIRRKCEEDVINYLSFQRHIIGLLIILSVFSMGVIFPMNYSGTRFESEHYFGITTIDNMDSEMGLWVHNVFSIFYFFLTVYSMRRHTWKMHDRDDDRTNCTLLVNGIPTDAEAGEIKHHFEKRAEIQKNHYLELEAQGITAMMTPKLCRHFWCFKCYKQEEAAKYYTKLDELLSQIFVEEKAKIEKKHLQMVFVTFQNGDVAERILRDFNMCIYRGCHCRQESRSSSNSAKLRTNKWTVSFAPDPHNVLWDHLAVSGIVWWLRFLIINALLIVILFFFTTPTIIMATLDDFNVIKAVETLNNPLITQFLPTFLLWLFSTLLPTIVYYSSTFESHWTRSTENQVTMHKCYVFHTLMVLILPSLGIGNLEYFFEWIFESKSLSDATRYFACMFLPDTSSFFVKCLIASGFTGNAMELMRLPALLVYVFRICLACSEAKRRNVRMLPAREFPCGASYAWMMCIFTIVMSYSITCPVIVPFGLVYMLIKQQVDRYNIYYVYRPTKLHKNIHSGAVNQAMVGPVLGILWLFFFFMKRFGHLAYITLFSGSMLILIFVIFFTRTFLGCFATLSPHNYQVDAHSRSQRERETEVEDQDTNFYSLFELK
ncbi:mechanosensitive cation channel TMEM63B-like isoform X2 [Stigmatopora nigra]